MAQPTEGTANRRHSQQKAQPTEGTRLGSEVKTINLSTQTVNVKKKKKFKDLVLAMDSIPAKSKWTWIQFKKAGASDSPSSSSVCRMSVNYKLLYMFSITGYSVLCMKLLSQSHCAM
jgi:hypothetical protein